MAVMKNSIDYFSNAQSLYAKQVDSIKMQTDRKSIIIFGAGKTAIKQYEWAVFAGYQVLFYVDNDSAKWGKAIGSLLVYSPAILNAVSYTHLRAHET